MRSKQARARRFIVAAFPLLACARPHPPAVSPASQSAYVEAYFRLCAREITRPILSADETTIYACDGRFDARTGRYLGSQRRLLAVRPDGALFVAGYDGGLEVAKPDGTTVLSIASDQVSELAVSPDGTRVASLEKKRSFKMERLVVRDAATLQPLYACGPPGSELENSKEQIGFARDGRVLCTVAPPSAVIHVQRYVGLSWCGPDGRWTPFCKQEFSKAGFAADGTAVAVIQNGDVRVLSLPDGAEIGRVSVPYADAVGVGVGARTLAVHEGSGKNAEAGLSIYLRDDGGRFSRVFRTQGVIADYLVFNKTADTLVAGFAHFHVIRRERPPDDVRALAYRPTLPAGFRPRVYREYEGPGLGELANYEYRGRDASVRVTVTDAAEYGPGDGWETDIFERREPYSGRISDEDQLQTWRTRTGGRAMEYRQLHRDGCEHSDEYVRFEEHGGALVQIELHTRPGEAPARVRRWLEAFFDAPLGPPPVRVVERSDHSRGGC